MSFRKGVESSRVSWARYGVSFSSEGLVEAAVVVGGGRIGDGEKTAAVVSAVSKSRIVSREVGFSQAGGWMLARRWRLRRRASQRGRGVGKGGLRGAVGPCMRRDGGLARVFDIGSDVNAPLLTSGVRGRRTSYYMFVLTPKSSRASRRWRGITVTCSISQRKPTSLGVSPGGRGRAMLRVLCVLWHCLCLLYLCRQLLGV